MPFHVFHTEEKQLVSGAKIETVGRSGTVYFIYTLKDSNTDKMQANSVDIIDTDTDEPYLLVKHVVNKDHFYLIYMTTLYMNIMVEHLIYINNRYIL